MKVKTVSATLSDGRTIEMTVPATMTNDEIAEKVRQADAMVTGNKVTIGEGEDDSYSELGSAGMGAIAGLTFDFADEIGGGVKSLFGDRTYEEYRDELRAEFDQAREDNPKSYLAGEVGSAFVPGLGMVKGAQLSARSAKLMDGLSTAGKAGVVGVGQGALAGAGVSEADKADSTGAYLGQLIADAGMGGLMGGVFGAGASKGLDGASYVLKKAGNAANDAFPSMAVRGAREVRQSLLNDNLGDVADVRARAAELGPEAMVADLGSNARSKLAQTAKPQGPGRALAEERLLARNDGAAGRVQQQTVDSLGDGEFNTIERIRQRQMDSLKSQARPLYDQAYEVVLEQTPTINRLLETPFFQRALKKAEESIKNDLNDDIGVDPENVSGLSTRMAHRVLRELDNRIEQTKPTGAKRGDSVAHNQLLSIKSAFRKEVFDQNPKFAEAQKLWAGGAAGSEALDAGRQALKGRDRSTQQVMDEYRALASEGERENFKSGVMDLIYSRLDNLADSSRGESLSVANKALQTGRDKQVVREIFDDGDALIKKLEQEAEYRKTYDSTLTGSQTYENSVNAGEVPRSLGEMLGSAIVDVAKRIFSPELTDEGRAAAVEALTKRVAEMSDDEIRKLLKGNNFGTKLTALISGTKLVKKASEKLDGAGQPALAGALGRQAATGLVESGLLEDLY